MSVIWNGSTKLQLQPVIKISERADSVTTVIAYRGPYSECIAKKPRIGNTISGFLGFIDGVDIDRDSGQVGTITISIKQGVGEDGELIGAGDQNEIIWELHWEKIQKPLAAHPRYTNKNNGYGNPAFNETTTKDTVTLQLDGGKCRDVVLGDFMISVSRIDDQDERGKELKKIEHSLDATNLVKDYLGKLGKGTDSYNAYTPTLTKRTTSPKRPTATGAGFIKGSKDQAGKITSSPPQSPLLASIPNAADFVWYKDGDDVTKTGRKSTYERTEVWVGVDSVDGDLYIARAQ